VYLGRISYSVYLIHLAALVFIRRFTHHSLASAAVAFAVTLCYAALSWKWVEQPILQRSHEGISPRPRHNRPLRV
jgi:peptidoglycan/LPS O-acetylase OafA/YrhL